MSQHIESSVDLEAGRGSPQRRMAAGERRSSLAAGSTRGRSTGIADTETSGTNKRPLNAVMSEDYLATNATPFSPFSVGKKCSSPPVAASSAGAAAPKQSFLSKFARSEVRSSKSIDKSGGRALPMQPNNETNNNNNTATKSSDVIQVTDKINERNNNNNNNNNEEESAGKDKENVETEGDKSGAATGNKSRGNVKQTSLGANLQATRASKSFCEGDQAAATTTSIIEAGPLGKGSPPREQQRTSDTSHTGAGPADDSDNQVLPAWPSRIDAAVALEPSLVQHQVYSLKNYSQVSGPSAGSPAASGAGARLQKSMSQDRKVNSRAKRMSECLLLTGAASASIDAKSGARQQRLPSMIGKFSANLNSPPRAAATAGGGGNMGPASSVNSLLLPGAAKGPGPALGLGESRIDRMRKLFVSPLSLRGSTSGGGGGGAKPTTTSGGHPGGQSRLSLQHAGANMLNKPHHLMHMYRARVAVSAHHQGANSSSSSGAASRRSPMRGQKQGNMKGFRVYGCPLSMANTMYPITCFGRPDIYKQQAVPYILARLCNYIEENSSQLTHEGIFRVSGNARLMEKLKTLFDHLGDAPLESESVDVATSASMLKMYLRELPDPLIPTRMNYYFFTLAKKYSSLLFKSSGLSGHGGGLNGFRMMGGGGGGGGACETATTTTGAMANEASSVSDSQSTLDRHKLAFLRDLTKLIRKLPIENYNLLKYLACFLHRISLKQHSNKMSAEALGIVFGPNVFRIRSESYKGLKEQELSNQIMASIISNYKQLFDCELTDPLGNPLVARACEAAAAQLLAGGDSSAASAAAAGGELGSATAGARGSAAVHHAATHAKGESATETTSGKLPTTTTTAPATTAGPETPPSSATTASQLPAPLHNNNHNNHHHHQKRCPRHGRPVPASGGGGGNYPTHSDDDDEDDDEEECDDDSYTRTSDSGSYCSSLASDTVESTYEGDMDDGEQYDDEEEEDDDDEGDDRRQLGTTSSDCGSETSYTPSSSHSDSDDDGDDNSDEDGAGSGLTSSEESNFSDSLASNLEGDKTSGGLQQSHKPPACRVCRRRESAQLEQLAAASNKAQRAEAPTLPMAQSGEKQETDASAEEASGGGGGGGTSDHDAANHTRQQPHLLAKNQLASTVTVSAHTARSHGPRVSTRRKRGGADAPDSAQRLKVEHTEAAAAAGELGQKKSASASDVADRRDDDDESALAQALEAKLRPSPAERAPPGRHATAASHDQHHHHAGQTAQHQQHNNSNKLGGHHHHKHSLLRRRSSSASSLLRISGHHHPHHRHQHPRRHPHHGVDQIAAAHKRGGGAATAAEEHPRQHHHRTRGAPGRLADSRAFNRKSRYKGGGGARGQHHHSHNHEQQQQQQQQQQQRAGGSGPQRQQGWNKGDYYVPELLTLNLSPQNRRELVWNYVSSALLDLPESERFFQLRSYNSDETLLRSQEYARTTGGGGGSEVGNESTELTAAAASLARRRFSGQDHLRANQANLLAQACTEFNQIFETYEGDGESLAAAEADSLATDLLHPRSLVAAAADSAAAQAELLDSSMISLLGDQLLSFTHSALSLAGGQRDNETTTTTTMESNNGESTGGEREAATRERSTVDPIVAQLKVTRDLVRALQKLTKQGAALGFNQDVSAYLLELLTSDLGNASGDSDDIASCYIDHLTSRSIVDSLDNLRRDVDDLPKVDSVIQNRLIELLGVKVAELKKRYNNLKYIREHYHRHHLKATAKPPVASAAAAAAGAPKTPDLSPSGHHQDGHSLRSADHDTLSLDSAQNVAHSTATSTGAVESGPSTGEKQQFAGSCKFGSLCPVEFVFNIEKHLASRRQSGSRQVRLNDMSLGQLQSEKLELQKNLLRYEHWFGRPASRAEFNLVGHLYERYRAVKIIKQRKQAAE